MKLIQLALIVFALSISINVASAQQNCPLNASIDSGPGDTAVNCTVTYTGSATGGTPPYTYSWSASTGDGASGSGQTISATAAVVGPGVMTLTVTDSTGATDSDDTNYDIHNTTETTGSASGGTLTPGTGAFVGPSVTCPANSPGNCSLAISATTTVSLSVGITVSTGVNLEVVSSQVGGTTTATLSSTTGFVGTFPVAPGQTLAAFCTPESEVSSGTWTTYDCTGQTGNGTWNNTAPASPDFNYTVKTPS